jgi:hypothetical protein
MISISVVIRLIALIVVVVCSRANVFTAEISPIPLRILATKSDLIVVGKVEYIIPFEQENIWDSAIARLEIKSVLKGPTDTRYIDVYYPADLVCPSPPYYEFGSTVLAFLESRASGTGYRTVGLSYGSKNINSEAIMSIHHGFVNCSRSKNNPTRVHICGSWLNGSFAARSIRQPDGRESMIFYFLIS